MFTLYQNSEFLRFKQSVLNFCKASRYENLELTDQEIMQLSWHKDNPHVTPEARDQTPEKLHFEIERSLARAYSLELLRKGDEKAYQAFIQDQNKDYLLSRLAFQKLCEEAEALDQDQYTVIRASCFLTMSEKAKTILTHAGLKMSSDSEEFLTQYVKEAPTSYLMPITSTLSIKQWQSLEKMYWPNMHLRHMFYTEGGNNMTHSFEEAVRNHTFSDKDFSLWKWRWLTNLFGFQGGKGAKYYDQQVHQIIEQLFSSLAYVFQDTQHKVLDQYLTLRSEAFGFNKKFQNSNAIDFLTHVACCFHQPKMQSMQLGEAIYEGYQRYLNSSDANRQIANRYAEYRQNPHLVTPTYLPAVLNNAYLIFRDKFMICESESIRLATHFLCDLQAFLFELPQEQRISYMTMAKEANLIKILTLWQKDPQAIQFFIDDKGECLIEERQLQARKCFR